MADQIYNVRDPSGTVRQIKGPAGASDADVIAQAKKLFGNAPTADPASQIPEVPPQPVAQPDASLGEMAVGAGEAGLSALTAGTTGALGYAGGALGGVAGSVKSGTFGTPRGTDEAARSAEEGAAKLTYQPRTASGQTQSEALGKAVDASGLSAINPSEGLGTGSLASHAAPELRAGGQGVKAATGAATRAGLSKLPSLPKVAPDTAALARKAMELDIPIRPDMLTDSKFARIIGEAFEKVPLSGSKAEQRQQAFNRAVMATIGADDKAHRLTPDVFDKAMTKSGQTIGDIAARNVVKMTPEFDASLSAHVDNAARFGTSDVEKIVTNYVQEIRSKVAAGAMPGEAYKAINSKIGRQIRSTANGDLKNALGELQDDMHDALTKSISGQDLAALQTARKQYAIGKTLEPLVAKSKDGDISPASLMSAVTSDKGKKAAMARGRGGDIGTLAKIGQLFLKEPASSGTAERGLAYGLMGGGAFAEPTTAASVYGAANLYNRLGPKLSRKLTQADVDKAKLGSAP